MTGRPVQAKAVLDDARHLITLDKGFHRWTCHNESID
jgi:hypothetical protein